MWVRLIHIHPFGQGSKTFKTFNPFILVNIKHCRHIESEWFGLCYDDNASADYISLCTSNAVKYII